MGGIIENWEKEMIENNRKLALETQRINNEILQIPAYLTEDEKVAYGEIVKTLNK